MSKEKIKEIFRIRDKAVSDHDKKLFMSTHLKGMEIKKSYSHGFMILSKLQSKVLHACQDDDNRNLWLAFVKEKYYHEKKFSHQGYSMYKIIQDNGKFVIFDIVW